MRSNLLAIIIAIIAFGGIFYFFFYHSGSPQIVQPQTVSPPQDNASTATNYDECIAEGNKPLPDALDKCLTADGHIFIQGVEE